MTSFTVKLHQTIFSVKFPWLLCIEPNEIINSAFNNKQINSQMMPMETDPALINGQMDQIQSQNITNIFLLSTVVNAQKYLLHTDEYMMNETFKWFIITNVITALLLKIVKISRYIV